MITYMLVLLVIPSSTTYIEGFDTLQECDAVGMTWVNNHHPEDGQFMCLPINEEGEL